MPGCEEIRGRLELYHDGELERGGRDEVEAHLGGCAACRDDLERLRRLEDLLRGTEAPAPADLDGQISRIRERIERPRRILPKRTLAAAAAVALAAFGITLWVGRPPGETIERKVARLVHEYLAAQNGRGRELAREITAYGAEAVPVVCRMVAGADPAEQARLAGVVAGFGEGERGLILEHLGRPRPEGDEIVLTSVAMDEEPDVELAMRLMEILAEGNPAPRFRRFAEREAEQLASLAQVTDADETIRGAVLKWLRSENPELVRRAAELASGSKLVFTDREIVALLRARSAEVRKGAHAYLVRRFGRDLGADPDAWRDAMR